MPCRRGHQAAHAVRRRCADASSSGCRRTRSLTACRYGRRASGRPAPAARTAGRPRPTPTTDRPRRLGERVRMGTPTPARSIVRSSVLPLAAREGYQDGRQHLGTLPARAVIVSPSSVWCRGVRASPRTQGYRAARGRSGPRSSQGQTSTGRDRVCRGRDAREPPASIRGRRLAPCSNQPTSYRSGRGRRVFRRTLCAAPLSAI
jgi:hypothetical protein